MGLALTRVRWGEPLPLPVLPLAATSARSTFMPRLVPSATPTPQPSPPPATTTTASVVDARDTPAVASVAGATTTPTPTPIRDDDSRHAVRVPVLTLPLRYVSRLGGGAEARSIPPPTKGEGRSHPENLTLRRDHPPSPRGRNDSPCTGTRTGCNHATRSDVNHQPGEEGWERGWRLMATGTRTGTQRLVCCGQPPLPRGSLVRS